MTLNPNLVTSCLLGIWTAWEAYRCRRYLRSPAVRERIAAGIILTLLGFAYATIIQNSAGNLDQYRQDQNLSLPVAGLMPLDSFDEQLIHKNETSLSPYPIARNHDLSIHLLSIAVFSDHQKLSLFFSNQIAQKSDAERKLIGERYRFEKYEQLQQSGKVEFERTLALNQRMNAIDTLHSMAERNEKFHASLTAGARHARQAPWMLRLCQWGLPLLCLIHLFVMWLCRRISPGAPDWLYPGFIFFTVLGFCLMTDISLNHLPKSRYISLYMFRDIIAACMLFPLVAAVRRNSRVERFVAATLHNPRRASFTALLLCVPALVACILYRKSPWLVSEILKYTLVACLAWIAAFRSDYLTRRIGMAGFFRTLLDRQWQWQNLKGFLLSFAFFLAGVIWCKDFGPLLLMTAVMSVWIYLVMGGASFSLITLLWGCCGATLYLLRGVLFRFGPVEHIYDRFMELLAPFRYGSGEIAKLIWMRRSAGLYGYPLGEFPYFGFFHNKASQLVVAPKELQSDYTATHIVGLWGYPLGGLMLAACLVWFWLIYRRSCQHLSSAANPMERYIGWLLVIGAITFVLQALLTIAGNGGLFALTGVTLPLISFGSTSLFFSTALVALLHANENRRHPHE